MRKKIDRNKPRFDNPPRFADKWADETRERCARAMARWLKQGLNIQRQICSLTLDEMKGLAEAATAEWIVCASHRPWQEPETPDDEAIRLLIS